MSRKIFSIIVFSFLLVLVSASLAFGQSSVPVNGCFSLGNLSGWAKFGGSWTVNGHGSCAEAASFLRLISSPVHFGSGSSVTYWATSDTRGCCGSVAVYVVDYTNGFEHFVVNHTGLSGSFQEFTDDLSSYAGLYGAVEFRGVSQAVSDISVSAVFNAYVGDGGNYNGTFTGGLAEGVVDSSDVVYYSGSGHDAAGLVQFVDQGVRYASFLFPPFVSGSGDWSYWERGGNNVTGGLYVANMTNGDYWQERSYSGSISGSWSQQFVDTSASAGDTLMFWWYLAPNGQGAYELDDVCPSFGCGDGEPFATMTATATATLTSAPSSTPFPTYTSVPTDVGGGGGGGVTGGGGSGLCPSDDPCYVIVSNTPLPVDLVGLGGTPISAGGGIPIQGGNSTPVVVAGATVAVTAVSAASSGVSVGGSSAVFRSGSVSGVMPVGGGGGDVADVVSVDVDKNDVGGCLPVDVASVINTDGNNCVSVPVYTVSSYKLLGVDLLAGFAVVAGVLFVVFIIRQLQEK